MVALIAANIGLIIWNKVPILNYAVGAFSVLIGFMMLSDATIPYNPYTSMLVILLAIISALAGVMQMRSD